LTQSGTYDITFKVIGMLGDI